MATTNQFYRYFDVLFNEFIPIFPLVYLYLDAFSIGNLDTAIGCQKHRDIYLKWTAGRSIIKSSQLKLMGRKRTEQFFRWTLTRTIYLEEVKFTPLYHLDPFREYPEFTPLYTPNQQLIVDVLTINEIYIYINKINLFGCDGWLLDELVVDRAIDLPFKYTTIYLDNFNRDCVLYLYKLFYLSRSCTKLILREEINYYNDDEPALGCDDICLYLNEQFFSQLQQLTLAPMHMTAIVITALKKHCPYLSILTFLNVDEKNDDVYGVDDEVLAYIDIWHLASPPAFQCITQVSTVPWHIADADQYDLLDTMFACNLLLERVTVGDYDFVASGPNIEGVRHKQCKCVVM